MSLSRSLRAPCVVLVVMLTACSAIRFEPDTPAAPATTAPSVAGPWTGMWSVEGQRVEGTMVVRQDGRDLSATFSSAAMGKASLGTGKVEDDGRVRLELAYDLGCPGNVQMTGSVQQGGSRIAGTLTAKDCTGEANGTFSFTR